jgi:hypothetical protein
MVWIGVAGINSLTIADCRFAIGNPVVAAVYDRRVESPPATAGQLTVGAEGRALAAPLLLLCLFSLASEILNLIS